MKTVLALMMMAASVSGCERASAAQQATKIADLEKTIQSLNTRLTSVESEQNYAKLLEGTEEIAYLTPGAEGYSIIRADLGTLTVKIENVEPYANGSRVTIQFGNLTSATINGAQAKIEWGSVDAKGSPNNDQAKSKDIKFSVPIRSGSWTKVPVVLEGVPPNELGFVRVRNMTHTGINLSVSQ